MNPKYIEALIANTKSMVERWHGRDAAMFELTKSHTTLVVTIFGDQYGNNLVVYCLAPEHICGPTQWSDSHIRIEETKLESGIDGVVLLDARNGVRITAESFEVKENVKI